MYDGSVLRWNEHFVQHAVQYCCASMSCVYDIQYLLHMYKILIHALETIQLVSTGSRQHCTGGCFVCTFRSRSAKISDSLRSLKISQTHSVQKAHSSSPEAPPPPIGHRLIVKNDIVSILAASRLVH